MRRCVSPFVSRLFPFASTSTFVGTVGFSLKPSRRSLMVASVMSVFSASPSSGRLILSSVMIGSFLSSAANSSLRNSVSVVEKLMAVARLPVTMIETTLQASPLPLPASGASNPNMGAVGSVRRMSPVRIAASATESDGD